MSRYIQQDQNRKPVKETKPRELPKPGKYTGKELTDAKKILRREGGKI